MVQTGQGTTVWVEVTWTVSRDAAASRRHESRRSDVASGNKKAKNEVSSMEVCDHTASVLPINIHPYSYIEPHHPNRARAVMSAGRRLCYHLNAWCEIL